MKLQKSIIALGWGIGLLVLAGCGPTMVISEVDYAQPIETVLVPDEQGMVQDVQHGLKFNVLPLQYAETKDSTSVTINEVRMIRGSEGFYYLTAPGYAYVYVMAPKKNELALVKKILITEEGIPEPAFNQRESYIQLLNRRNNEVYSMNIDGLIESETNKGSDEEAK